MEGGAGPSGALERWEAGVPWAVQPSLVLERSGLLYPWAEVQVVPDYLVLVLWVGRGHVVLHSPTWPPPDSSGVLGPVLVVSLASFEQQQPQLAAQPG